MRPIRASEKTAKAVAAMLAAVSAVAGAFPAAAQQMALGAQLSACDQIKDPAKSAQCHHDVHLAEAKAKLQAATSRVVAADQNMVCAKFLLAKKAEGVALDPTRANREKGCAYAKELGMQ
jgi:hypothetical protein